VKYVMFALLALFSIGALAQITTTDVGTALDGAETTAYAVGTLLIALLAVFTGIRWVKGLF